jgi:cytochrome c oxidase cbb3-type subunit 3
MPVVPLTVTQVEDIVGYLKARIAEVDKTSGLRPARDYDLKKLLTGNAELGKAYFNGAGQCATCHSPPGDLKGIGRRRIGPRSTATTPASASVRSSRSTRPTSGH